jgi:hypothetical protein
MFDAFSNEKVEQRLREQGFTEGPITAVLSKSEVEEVRVHLDEHYLADTAIWYDRNVMWIMATDHEILVEVKLKFELVPKSA